MLNWSWKSANRKNRPQARKNRRQPSRLPLRLECLEDRTLLSFSTPVLASVNSAGSAAGDNSSATNADNPRVLSADGTLEVFTSTADNLTGDSNNGNTNVFVRNLVTGVTTLVSINAAGTAAGDNFSDSPVISADGHFVAFRSFASDLVSTPTGGVSNIFVRDLVAGTTTLVSVNSAGNAGSNDFSDQPDISDDGNIIAYRSNATDLVGGFADANGGNSDLFARNRTTNTTVLVSVNRGNGSTGGNGFSDTPVVSGDGSRVVFRSGATDLVTGLIDNNSAPDLFVRSLATNTTAVISAATSAATTANSDSFLTSTLTGAGHRSLSGDGRFEVFSSMATDLVAVPDGNSAQDVFVRDRQTGVVTLVSINAAGTAAGETQSDSPVISANGRFVAFRSFATDLVSTPTDFHGNIFVRDLVAGTTTLVSVNSAGSAGGNGLSDQIDISDDGNRIVFHSFATDLVSTPTVESSVFLRDLVAGTTTLISVNSSGSAGGNSVSQLPVISGDGTHIAFESFASDLIAGITDTNNASDVFVRTVGGITRLASINSSHTATGNIQSDSPVLSADGKVVAFRSFASDLVSGDTNGASDVYVFDETANTTTLVSASGSGTVGNRASDEPSISNDGNLIAFRSNASNLASADSNFTSDIFVRNRSAGTTTLVSVNLAGTSGANADSALPAISGNGQVVVFESSASNLVTGISGLTGKNNIYARNLAAGATVLVSINPAGTASGNRDTFRADVSADGRVVAFDSNASNLTAGDVNNSDDVFARNLVANNGQAANTTEAVSAKAAGFFTGDRGAGQAAVSFSGQFVAFRSDAIGLTSDDTNGHVTDVFLRDVVAGTTVLVSESSAGVASNDTSDSPSISSDGNRIAFRSFAHLAAPDTNAVGDIYVRDRAAGTTTLVSINAAGTSGGDTDSDVPVISGNGQVVAFRSSATNLVTGISGLDGSTPNIYARNLVTGETNLLSVNAAGNASGNSSSNAPRLSADGKTATFTSFASNLVGAGVTDGNGTEDVFANRRIGISISGLSQREGDSGTTVYSFTVTLSAPSGQTVTVHFATADGTATTANSDYQATSGDLVFNPGQTSKTVTVQVNGDTTPEPDESFVVNLTSASNAEIFVGSAQGTIQNDDATISIDDGTRVEGDSGTTDAVFTVSIPFASAVAVTVHFATANGTATTANSDYQATSGDLTFAPGDTSKTITVAASGDTTPEPDETFFVNLSNPVNAQLTDGQGAGAIRNDDAALSISDLTLAEGNTGTTPFSFTVSIPFASTNPVTVHFATADGTATAAGNDYQPASGDLTFAPGDTSKMVTVQVNGDLTAEPDETFVVNLSSPSNASLAKSTGAGTIVGDDAATPQLSINDVAQAEGNAGTTDFVFTVSLSFAIGQDVVVNFATADGSAATADNDYLASAGSVTIAAGTTAATITVKVAGDSKDEANETFFINLTGATNAGLADSQGAGTVSNDDPQPTLSIDSVSKAEGNVGTTAFVFTVSLSAPSGQVVTVDVATANGSAAAPGDYTAVGPTTLTFNPGDTTRTVTVLVSGSTDIEPDETFFVNLSKPTNAGIVAGTGTGTIVNDDALAPTLDPIPDPTIREDAATQVVNLSGISAGVLPIVATATSNNPGLIPNPAVSYTSPSATGSISFQPLADANGSALVTVTVTDGAGTSVARSFSVNVLPVNDAPSFAAINPPTSVQDQGPQTVVNWANFNSGPANEAGQSVLAYTVTNVSNPSLFAVLPSIANNGTLTYTAADFAAGTATFTVVVRDNGGTANGGVDLSAPQTFTIRVEQVAVVQFAAATVAAAENLRSASITVTRTGNLASAVTVQFSTADGTARADSDYTAVSQTLTFAAGQTSLTVTVPILDDTVFEGDETIRVTLSSPGARTVLGSPATALVTIQDNDPPVVNEDTGTFQFQNAVLSAAENAAVTLTITRTGSTAGSAALQVATHDGAGPLGAVAGQDFTATSLTVTFAPGETSKTVSIPVLDDAQIETRETFTVVLSNPSAGATLGRPAQATVTVRSDDGTPNQRYVVQLYADVLLRLADDEGLAFWSGLLDRGTPRFDVARGIWESPEHRGLQVDQYYATFLARAAEPAGRAFWIDRFLGGASEFDVERGIVTSVEFQHRFPSPLDYVNGLYALMLGRDVDPLGLALWPSLAEQPNGRDAVARGILTSEEDERRLLDQFYADFLHREPDAEGEQAWLAQFQSASLSLAQVAEGFLVSEEYTGLQS